jgi:hypothetical protein
MRYFIFKSPRKPGDQPLETLAYEPGEFTISNKAVKYGPIVVISEEAIKNEDKT